GVFFYHVIEGLKGKADANRDGKVMLNELDEYVRRQVSRTVAVDFGVQQTPQRMGSEVGLPPPLAVVDPRAQPPAVARSFARPADKRVFVPETPGGAVVKPEPPPKAKEPEAKPA